MAAHITAKNRILIAKRHFQMTFSFAQLYKLKVILIIGMYPNRKTLFGKAQMSYKQILFLLYPNIPVIIQEGKKMLEMFFHQLDSYYCRRPQDKHARSVYNKGLWFHWLVLSFTTHHWKVIATYILSAQRQQQICEWRSSCQSRRWRCVLVYQQTATIYTSKWSFECSVCSCECY